MADKDKYVNIADLKAKLRYWCKSRGASKQVQESLMETIKRIPYTLQADISETLEVRNGWIPCSERLPEQEVRVLLLADGEVWLGELTDIKDVFDTDIGFLKNGRVTHWMPLPKPPESEVHE